MGWRQAVIRLLAERDTTDRAAALAATIAVGQSFAPSLLPRSAGQQAVVTGINASVLYGLVRTTQSFIEYAARRIVPGGDRVAQEHRRSFALLANSAAVAAGIGVQRALDPKRGEPLKRATLRTLGWQVSAAGALGLTVTTISVVTDRLAKREGRVPVEAIPAGFALGVLVAAGEIIWYRRRQPAPPPVLSAVGQGLGVMTGVSVLSVAERQVAGRVAQVVRTVAPGYSGLAEPLGHLVALGPVVVAGWFGLEFVNRRAEIGGAAVEHAYSRPPRADTASGGPHSVVGWDTLGREGRRFVNMTLSPSEITDVTGAPAIAPVRAFVGLGSATSVDARVSLAMDELETLGAFDRSVLCLASPTGTGYVNYVVAETLEYLTGGDCATVAMQYSLRPSFLSLDRVALGREQNRALLHAINGRLRGIPAERRPRLVAVGESLGAFTLQDAFLHEGTAGLHRAGIERGLFIGTPAESGWASAWRLDRGDADPDREVVEVDGLTEWEALPPERQAQVRYILLSHHDDPICKFGPALAVQSPGWMGDGAERSPALPDGVQWRPLTTFLLTTVDVLNATEVVPGQFARRGHDYRTDLAEFTRIAFRLDADTQLMAKVESALRRRELAWAEKRLVAEQLARARESIQRQLKSWTAVDEAPAAEIADRGVRTATAPVA